MGIVYSHTRQFSCRYLSSRDQYISRKNIPRYSAYSPYYICMWLVLEVIPSAYMLSVNVLGKSPSKLVHSYMPYMANIIGQRNIPDFVVILILSRSHTSTKKMGGILSKKSENKRPRVDSFKTRTRIEILSMPPRGCWISIEEFDIFVSKFKSISIDQKGEYLSVGTLADELLIKDELELQEWLTQKSPGNTPVKQLSFKDAYTFLYSMAYPPPTLHQRKLIDAEATVISSLNLQSKYSPNATYRGNIKLTNEWHGNTTLGGNGSYLRKLWRYQIEFPYDLVFHLFSTADLIDFKDALNIFNAGPSKYDRAMAGSSFAALLRWVAHMETYVGSEVMKSLQFDDIDLDFITQIAYSVKHPSLSYEEWVKWMQTKVSIVSSCIISRFIRIKFFSGKDLTPNISHCMGLKKGQPFSQVDLLASRSMDAMLFNAHHGISTSNPDLTPCTYNLDAKNPYSHSISVKIKTMLAKAIHRSDVPMIWFLCLMGSLPPYIAFYRPRPVCLFSTNYDGVSTTMLKYYVQDYNAPTILVIHTRGISETSDTPYNYILVTMIKSSWINSTELWPISDVANEESQLFVSIDETTKAVPVKYCFFHSSGGIGLSMNNTIMSDSNLVQMSLQNCNLQNFNIKSRKAPLDKLNIYINPHMSNCYIREVGGWVQTSLIRLAVYGLGDRMCLNNWATAKEFEKKLVMSRH